MSDDTLKDTTAPDRAEEYQSLYAPLIEQPYREDL